MTHLTYMWLREDGSPYYVGKDSSGTRAYREGSPPPERIVTQEHSTEAEALAAEIFLIAFYGRKDIGTGILRNFTDGGEGASGRLALAEMRHKLRTFRTGRKESSAFREKASERAKILKSYVQLNSPDRVRIPWNKGKKGTQVAWNKGRKETRPEVLTNISKGQSGLTHTEARKAKRLASYLATVALRNGADLCISA